MFTHVNHPGVIPVNHGDGYMQLGAELAVEKNLNSLVKDVSENVLRQARASFAKKWQKK